MDETQWRYFSEVATSQVERGDRIILCMSKEVEGGGKVFSDRNLDYLERRLVRPTGAQVVLYLKSGRHHYSRYQEEDGPRHHITAGGGGAFLHPTHQLPPQLDLPAEEGQSTFRRAATYPSPASSRRLRKRIWLLPLYNLPLAALFGVVQVLLAFNLGLHLHDGHRSVGIASLRRALWESPTAFILIVLMVVLLAAMVRFAHDARGLTRLVLGLVHSSLQLAGLAGSMIAASRLSSALGLRGAPSLIVFLGLLFLLGGIGGTLGPVRLPVGDQLPRLPRERGLRAAPPHGPEELPPPAHRRRRGPDRVSRRGGPSRPRLAALSRCTCPCPLVRPDRGRAGCQLIESPVRIE
ncbi:MAG: hypothetical protein M3378_02435 [Actinomycetota bacterium]|nr:hypothetical protein [Actinomycetota bacterium]